MVSGLQLEPISSFPSIVGIYLSCLLQAAVVQHQGALFQSQSSPQPLLHLEIIRFSTPPSIENFL
jgi:hypothetical protein